MGKLAVISNLIYLGLFGYLLVTVDNTLGRVACLFMFFIQSCEFARYARSVFWENSSEYWRKECNDWREIAEKANKQLTENAARIINQFVEDYLEGTEIENHTITWGDKLEIKIGNDEEMVVVDWEKNGDLIAAMEAAVMEWRANYGN